MARAIQSEAPVNPSAVSGTVAMHCLRSHSLCPEGLRAMASEEQDSGARHGIGIEAAGTYPATALGLTGASDWIARAIPRALVRGIQLGWGSY